MALITRRTESFVYYFVVIVILALTTAFGSVFAQNRNSVSGNVFDPTGRPVSQVYVELQNELYMMLGRVRTDGSGRFYFGNLSGGNFKVKVLTLGTNFQEETQDASIINFVRDGRVFGAENVYLEFKLKYDKRKINIGSGGQPGVIFTQEVPTEAKKMYEKGIDDFREKREEPGIDKLRKAIEIFPTYYDALDFLSTELVKREKYQEALPYLVKTIDVNQRSFTGYYNLGFVCYKLKHYTESSEALRAATVINPQSINANLLYGTILRIQGNFEKAEEKLKQAKILSKNSPVAQIHFQLALLYHKTGKYQSAADELETFLKIQPDSRDAKQIRDLIAQFRTKAK